VKINCFRLRNENNESENYTLLVFSVFIFSFSIKHTLIHCLVVYKLKEESENNINS